MPDYFNLNLLATSKSQHPPRQFYTLCIASFALALLMLTAVFYIINHQTQKLHHSIQTQQLNQHQIQLQNWAMHRHAVAAQTILTDLQQSVPRGIRITELQYDATQNAYLLSGESIDTTITLQFNEKMHDLGWQITHLSPKNTNTTSLEWLLTQGGLHEP